MNDAVAVSAENRPSPDHHGGVTSVRSAANGGRGAALARAGLRGLWFVVIPALLAGLAERYLVPTPAEARGTWAASLARLADDHDVALLTGLFLLFTALLRYWHGWIAMRGYLEPTPASTTSSLVHPRSSQRTVSLVATALVAAALAVMVRGFFFGSYRVLSASMLPTLEPNDLLAGSKLGYANRRSPERGDIVVFKKPDGIEGPDRLIKRVVGLPGDHVAMNGGHVVLNGVELPSCDAGTYLYPVTDGAVRGRLIVEFLEGRPYLTVFSPGADSWQFNYEVKPGEVFVLGDNRNNSSDSRFWNHGKGAGLSISDIEARVEWHLFGSHRNDRTALWPPFEPLELHIRLEGMQAESLREGVRQCLEQQPIQSKTEKARGL